MRFAFKRRAVGLALVGAIAVSGLSVAPSFATTATKPEPVAAVQQVKPAPIVGQQVKAPVAPGSLDKLTPAMKPLGPTQLRAVNANGSPAASNVVTPQVGYNSNVDFSSFYNYCEGALTYTYVYNYSASTQYFEELLYDANGGFRTYYASVAPNSYAYPYYYGVNGSYYAYLYVWNGSSYAYDEYKTSANTCSVSYTFTTATGYTGYVLLTAKNNGNDYAYVDTNELAPYPASGTYTGEHWLYPAPNGGSVSEYLYVGTTSPYGIYADNYGAFAGVSSWHGLL